MDSAPKGEFNQVREREVSLAGKPGDGKSSSCRGNQDHSHAVISHHEGQRDSQGPYRLPWISGHHLGTIAAATPTISVRGRNLAVLVCARLWLKLNRGDVKAAFLQSVGVFVSSVVLLCILC